MKIKWYGHSAFLLTSDKGIRIITDPYQYETYRPPYLPEEFGPKAWMFHTNISEPANVVTMSHDHRNHRNIADIGGEPYLYHGPSPAVLEGIKFSSVATFHDDTQGKDRGPNTIICMDFNGIRVCHLGDLGHTLTDEQIKQTGKVDILLIPVGSHSTIGPDNATEVCNQLKPKVIFPMHYRDEKCVLSFFAPVDDFLKGKQNVIKTDASEIEIQEKTLPEAAQIIVLKPAL